MKLFVWRGVYTDYTSGMAFAIAESADQARALISRRTQRGDSLSGTGEVEGAWHATLEALKSMPNVEIDADLEAEPEVYDLDKPIGFGVYGGG